MSTKDTDLATMGCPNPRCNKQMNADLSEIVIRGKIKCQRCGSEVIFNSSSVNALKRASSELEKAKINLMNNYQTKIRS